MNGFLFYLSLGNLAIAGISALLWILNAIEATARDRELAQLKGEVRKMAAEAAIRAERRRQLAEQCIRRRDDADSNPVLN